jgi:hypothetical protein
MKLITIRKSNIESELAILRSKLESEGIACFMKNELTTQIMNFLPSFEIELQIRDSDLNKAKEIMSKMMDS